MQKFIKKIPDSPRWLNFTLIGVFLVRIPSLFTPYHYGDELIYLILGNAIRRGLVLYRDIHDNKTPLIYFLAAFAGNVFWFRAILCFWMLATIFAFWKLSQILFPKKESVQRLTTIVFAFLTSFPTLEGQTPNSELFLIGPLIVAFIFALKKENRIKNMFLAGLFVSFATLLKVPAVFDTAAILFLPLFFANFTKKTIKQFILESLSLIAGIALPIGLSFVWYYLRGAGKEYFTAAFLQNIGYVASTRIGSIENTVPILTKLTPIATRGGIAAFGFILLFVFRKKLGKPYILATLWLLTSLFAATLSERPYPHYLVQAIPAFSILLGMLLSLKVKEQALTVIPLTLCFLVPVYYKFWYYDPLPYFGNFIKLLEGTPKDEYLNLFGGQVARNYKISKEILKTVKQTDSVFVWGDAPPIYALTSTLPPIKYVANYHIYDYSSTIEVVGLLSKNMPRLIVLLPEEKVPPELYSFVKTNYHPLNSVEGAAFWYNNAK